MHPEWLALPAFVIGCIAATVAAGIWGRSAEHAQRIGMSAAAICGFTLTLTLSPILMAMVYGSIEPVLSLCCAIGATIVAAPCGLAFGAIGWMLRNKFRRDS